MVINIFATTNLIIAFADLGRLKDNLGSYDAGFYLAGSMIAASGLMLFFIPCLQRITKSRDQVSPNAKPVVA